MRKVEKEFPVSKKQLIESFGFLSFQTALINIDLVAIRIIKSYEVVVIAFRGSKKVGFIYEGGTLTSQQVLRVFSDVPEDWNHLESWENSMGGKIELLYPAKGNYVFINDKEVVEAGKKQLKTIEEKSRK